MRPLNKGTAVKIEGEWIGAGIIIATQGADIILGQVVDCIGKICFGRTITTARSLTWLARISHPCSEAMQKQEVEEVGQHHRRR